MEEQSFSGSLMADADQMVEGIAELERTLEEPITIKRFASQIATPGAFGTQQKLAYTDFPATAVVVSQGVAAEMFKAGVMSAGDIVLQIRELLRETDENIGGSYAGDLVVWRGYEYRMVQRGDSADLNASPTFYTYLMRRTNAKTDVGGL